MNCTVLYLCWTLFPLGPMPNTNSAPVATAPEPVPISEVLLIVTTDNKVEIPLTEEQLDAIQKKPKEDFPGERSYATIALEIVRLRQRCAAPK